MNLRTRVGLHLAACAAATVAGTSSAAIVWSGIVNLNIPSNIDGVYLNVVTGQSGSAGSSVPGWDVNPYGGSTLQFFPSTGGGYARGQGSSTTLVDNLAFGTVIGAALSFGSGTGGVETTGATAFNLNSSQNLVGFRFTSTELGAGTYYGWMRIEVGATLAAQPRSIVEYAYEDSGTGIIAGNIPAPGALAVLGLAGLAGRRRRA